LTNIDVRYTEQYVLTSQRAPFSELGVGGR
jgi:hypothetical protein